MSFVSRHIGPRDQEIQVMLKELGYDSLAAFSDAVVPEGIRLKRELQLPEARSEVEALQEMRAMAGKNKVFRSYLGTGYYDTVTPPVILRNVLENPCWYTQYTPYQAEIAQGRLEALFNFQTMIADLTGLPVSNASLLDEATAAAEAMAMCLAQAKGADKKVFFVDRHCHPQTIDVVKTRAHGFGVQVQLGDVREWDRGVPELPGLIGALFQYPNTFGEIPDLRPAVEAVHRQGALVVLATDLLALTHVASPGELGADIALGSAQRFGVPMGFGGPHAAFMAVKDELKRLIPGRIVGLSQDVQGQPALRLALQTREQHIRRDKALSNICTAQVLLAIMSSFYAVYHGPEGLKAIATRIHRLTRVLRQGLEDLGFEMGRTSFFDTLLVKLTATGGESARELLERARQRKINLRHIDGQTVGISLDETTQLADVSELLQLFAGAKARPRPAQEIWDRLPGAESWELPDGMRRLTTFLSHSVFHSYHSETELLRYMHRLESRDLSLATAMIPLGSCTMKLNATTEMLPVTWPEMARIHPFVPKDQAEGYSLMMDSLRMMLSEITGFPGISFQPNAGSQGEYAGLLVIKKFHEGRGEKHRDVCLIPKSAHGTNPASASMAGLKVVVVDCDDQGNISIEDLKRKAQEHALNLSALMVTYPSTHGVFESSIKDVCKIVHDCGGQVYMDGANMNAQVGLCRPADLGADVCHLNLHKTFCIPHGGGGPGMGPIGVASHLMAFLPTHPLVETGGRGGGLGAVSAAPYGSASILPISWSYIAMMGAEGLKKATQVALLSANYLAKRLDAHYPVLYKGATGWVAHECIIDLRPLKLSAGIEVQDVAKRLMDYGFHAPTVSFPVPGTMMIEPTESESLFELNRFVDAMVAIRSEIREVEEGKAAKENNIVKNAPHTASMVCADEWSYPYSRERAAFPTVFARKHKFWPAVGRINEVLGDRQLICSCPPTENYQS